MKIIHLERLEKSFDSTFRLGPLDLEVQAGEILGIMGPNGAGKTTLLRMVWGFLRPDKGSISVFGMKPHIEQIKVRLRAGYLSESPAFYDGLNARQFLAFIANFYEGWDWARADSLLTQLQINPEIRIDKLSKGSRIKLGLISTIGHRPSLLILDEPTSGLDPLMRIDILTLIRRLAREEGVCVVMSSHISDDLDRIADSILMLNDGKVVEYAQGTLLTAKYGLSQLEAIFLHAIERLPKADSQHRPKGLA